MNTIQAADLFCGAGGTSTGLYLAADELCRKVNLLAVNHWPVAIATHSANHLQADHLCETLDGVNPRKVVPSGWLNLLVASPECTHHSNARGGRPMNDQSRASAWHVIRWAEAIRIDNIIVENVREFMGWGPLGVNNLPLKSRKGETFQAWLQALRSLNYTVDHRVLNAADFGDPTTRERLFVIARRGRKAVRWPEPTHTKDGKPTLFGSTEKWRAAREIIDWTDQGNSIFNRKKPLSPNTIRRIAVGLRKFSGMDLEPFLVKLYGTSDAAPIGKPVPTVTGNGQHIGVAQPFILPKRGRYGKNQPRSIDDPAQTVMPHHGLGHVVEPFLVNMKGKSTARDIDSPAPTQTAQPHQYLAEPFVLGQQSGSEPRSTDLPIPTVSGKGAIAKVEPFLVAHFGEREGQEPRVHSMDNPTPAVTSRGAGDLVQPFITEFHGGPDAAQRVKPMTDPLPTQTTEPRFGIAQPFMMSAGGPVCSPRSTEDPANTVLTRDHIGVVQPFIAGAGGPARAGEPQPVDKPLGTVMARNHKAVVEPFIVPVSHAGERRGRSIEEPLPTVTGAHRGELGVVQPFIVPQTSTGAPRSTEKPVPTITTTSRGIDIAQAFLVQYNGTADAKSLEQPIGALTGKPRYALLVIYESGERYLLDIRFRMLKPRELARAQGFPDSYQFTGKTEDVVKQIGNAVPVNLAKALCKAVLA